MKIIKFVGLMILLLSLLLIWAGLFYYSVWMVSLPLVNLLPIIAFMGWLFFIFITVIWTCVVITVIIEI